nr:vegetative incompatibility protein het-e-1 [Quercus suber]
MRASISTALDEDSGLCVKGLQEQFEKLILRPLSTLNPADVPRQRIAIAVDALDECDRSTDIPLFLRLLAQVEAASTIQLRIFLTSRPELPVKLGFRELDADGKRDVHQDIVLEEAQEETIGRDIRAYFDAEFAKIRRDRSDNALLKDWPNEADLQTLVEIAVPLFIFASMICRFVSEMKPQTRLKSILAQRYAALPSHLAKTYLPILDHMLEDKGGAEQNEIIQDFQKIVGPIILAVEPLSVTSLAGLLRIQPQDINEEISDLLKDLHSVLDIPSSLGNPVRLLHLSFRDFLIDKEREDRKAFWIDEAATHAKLASYCLGRLRQDGALQKDICHAVRPGTRRSETSEQEIKIRISPDVAYACSYWPKHFLKSGEPLLDNSLVHDFLQQHFLHWLEALSWLGKLSSAVAYLSDLLLRARVRYVVDLVSLQIYHSAMTFTPVQSIVRQTLYHQASQLWACSPKMSKTWSAETQKFEGHDSYVVAVAFSPDGQVIASTSGDRTIRLWNVVTGEQTQKLEGHDGDLSAVAFSSDGQIIASASTDQTVRLWNAVTGEQIHKLEGHNGIVNSVAFSLDGQVIASASHDRTVRLWNTATGEQRQKLEGHSGYVGEVAFSPTVQVIVSVSDDRTIRLWNATTGEQMQMMEGHDGRIRAVDFSPDGQVIASGLDDQTVRLWSLATGEQTQKLEGHDNWVKSVAFSPDGQVIASASDDRTVRLWNAATGEQTQKLGGHDDTVSTVVFSPGGRVVASASADQTVRLWDAVTGKQTQKLEGHDDCIRAVAFSPDGQVVASTSNDRTVRLWSEATGEQTRELEGHDNWVKAVAFSPDGQVIALASDDRTVRLWDVATGEQRQKLEGHDGRVSAVDFSPDGQVIASASDGQTVRLWNVVTGEQTQKLEWHDGNVSIVGFSHSGKVVASVSDNWTVRLWNAVTGEMIQLIANINIACTIAFSADGKSIQTDAGTFLLKESVSGLSADSSA